MKRRKALFPLGKLLITPAAEKKLVQMDIDLALEKHIVGDWGNLDEYDIAVNDCAVLQQGRLLSAYEAINGTKFWVITEADRSITTILLPNDY